jgi:hypothetical protein
MTAKTPKDDKNTIPPIMEPTGELVEITPAMAREWLEKNIENNRGVRPSVVEAYARDMVAGEWYLREHIDPNMRHLDLRLGEHSKKILRGMIADQPKACDNEYRGLDIASWRMATCSGTLRSIIL